MNPEERRIRSSRIREQLDLLCGQFGCSSELIEQPKLRESGFEDLRNWLNESYANRDQLGRHMDVESKLDALLKNRIRNVDFKKTEFQEIGREGNFSEQLASRIKAKVASAAAAGADVTSDQNLLTASSNDKLRTVETSHPSKSGWSRRNWLVGISASVVTVAASIALVIMMQPSEQPAARPVTTEALCLRSLDWNPNQNGNWQKDLAAAPSDRLFPSHLIRFRAQSWKQIDVEGDSNAVVYNLIPENDLSSLKAYVYVMKPDGEYELPMQFDSIPDANRRYKFWSVACREDLVYVLVFEGESSRISELIRQQKVG